MKTEIRLILLFIGIMISIKTVDAQVTQVITEDFRLPKDSCDIYIYKLRDYLKSKGLYEDAVHEIDTTAPLKDLKKKLTFDGKCLVNNYQFIIEIWGTEYTENIFDDWGAFGLIEIGFESEIKAHEIFLKAREISKKYTMNIPVYVPPFRALQVGKSVLIAYSINYDYDKYRDMAEKWQPGME